MRRSNEFRIHWIAAIAYLILFLIEIPFAPAQSPLPSAEALSQAIQAAQAAIDAAEAERSAEARTSLNLQAQQAVDAVKVLDESTPWLLLLYGRLNILAGRPSEARDLLRKFVESREGRSEPSAYRLMGDLFADEFPRLALFHYGKAADLKPNDPAILQGLSICHQRLGELDKAASFSQEAVASDGRRNARYLTQLATVLGAQKRWSAAEGEAAEALRLTETGWRDRPGSSEAATETDIQLQLLISILQSQIRESPADSEAYVRLSMAMRRQAEVAAVKAAHERVNILTVGIRLAGESVSTSLRQAYAVALAESGRRVEAITAFTELLDADPTNSTAVDWIKRLKDTPATPGISPMHGLP